MPEETVNTDVTGAETNNQTDNPGSVPANNDTMIPKARFDQVNQQKKSAIEALKAVADSLAEDVPEDFRDIIPNLPPAEKITWIRNAVKKGIFNRQVNDGLDSKRPGAKPPVDFSNMTTEQIIARGYK